MAVISAIAACVVLGALGVVQIAVAAGAPWGRLVWGGTHRTLPRRLRVGSAVSVALYAAFAWIILARAGVIAGSESPFVHVASWVLFGYFTLGILVNAASRSVPERLTMSPACAVLAASTLVVALS